MRKPIMSDAINEIIAEARNEKHTTEKVDIEKEGIKEGEFDKCFLMLTKNRPYQEGVFTVTSGTVMKDTASISNGMAQQCGRWLREGEKRGDRHWLVEVGGDITIHTRDIYDRYECLMEEYNAYKASQRP